MSCECSICGVPEEEGGGVGSVSEGLALVGEDAWWVEMMSALLPDLGRYEAAATARMGQSTHR